MSSLKNMDWYTDIEEYTPDNKIVDVLEENEYDDYNTLASIGINTRDFDESTFSIYADL